MIDTYLKLVAIVKELATIHARIQQLSDTQDSVCAAMPDEFLFFSRAQQQAIYEIYKGSFKQEKEQIEEKRERDKWT